MGQFLPAATGTSLACGSVWRKSRMNLSAAAGLGMKSKSRISQRPSGCLRSGNVTYQVLEAGHLTITGGGSAVLVDEEGEWQDADGGR